METNLHATFTFILLILFFIFPAQAARHEAYDVEFNDIMYISPDRSTAIVVSKLGGMSIISTVSISTGRDSYHLKSPGHLSDKSFNDCSDDVYRCIIMGYETLAVPRKDFSVGDKFIVNGSTIGVVKCNTNNSGVCTSFLMVTHCPHLESEIVSCINYTPKGRPEIPGIYIYYIYHKAFGITAFGSSIEEAKNIDDAKRIAMQYVLILEYGILK